MLSKIGTKKVNLFLRNQWFYGITPQFMHPLEAGLLMDQFTKPTKRTKTICTIGKRTQNKEMTGILIDGGMNVARLNFSHGYRDDHLQSMVAVQEAVKERQNSHVSFMLETKGPEIRTGLMTDNKPVTLKKGQLLQLTTDFKHVGTNERIACSFPDLPQAVKVGKPILFADGSISTVVKSIDKGIVTVEVLNDGRLGSKKNVYLPQCPITLPTISKDDQLDIVDFGLKNKVNYIAVSFARSREDLMKLRKYLIEKDPVHGQHMHLISKIENRVGLQNIDQIISGSDGIMIGGHLGMEIPIQKTVLLQKFIMGKTIDAGKYSICATKMLESMENKPRPTRAEVSDITNSVLDVTDALMLSGQATNGAFPTECTQILRTIAQQAELTVAYKRIFTYKQRFLKADKDCLGAIALSFEVSADLIFLHTDSVALVNRLSSLRPRAYIIVFSDAPHVKNLVAINFGVYCFPKSYSSNPEQFCGTVGKGFVRDGPTIILELKTDKHNTIIDHHIIRI